MDLPPFQSLQSRQPRSGIAGRQEEITAGFKQRSGTTNDFARPGQVFDGVSHANGIKGNVKLGFQ